MSAHNGAAIAGLGMTEMRERSARTTAELAGEAIALALSDAGLAKDDVDGLLVTSEQGPVESDASLPAGTIAPDAARPLVQLHHGFRDLSVFNVLNAAGASAGSMLQYASLAIAARVAQTIVLVHAAAEPPGSGTPSAAAPTPGVAGLAAAYGGRGDDVAFAHATRRHMHLYGTTSEQLGAIAVGQRAWARSNPHAQLAAPLTLADHQASPALADPLRRADRSLTTSGAIALVVTSAERAADLRQPPVHVRAVAQAAPGDNQHAGHDPWIHTGARSAGERAFAQAGITHEQIDLLQLADDCTYGVLVTLEDYGFCAKGDGGPLVAGGALGPGGALPTNTGGGQLSGYAMWDFTPLSEAVIQTRGQGGARQQARHDHTLVSGSGGTFNFHATAILSAHPR